MSVNTEQLFDRQIVTQISQSQEEPTWMLQKRLAALDEAAKLSLPKLEKTRIDRWNFTSFDPYRGEEALTTIDTLPENVRQFVSAEKEDHVFVQKNSSPVYQQLSADLKEKGVIFTDIATAAREHGDLVQKHFMTDGINPNEHRLAALHTALFSGGLLLYVPKNVAVELPFQALFWASGKGVGNFPHVLVVLETGANASIIANFVSDEDSDAVVNGAFEVFLGDNARLSVASLHTHGEETTEVAYRRTVVGRDAHLDWTVGDLNGGRTISDNTTHMQGSGSNGEIKAITVGAGEQRSNITSTFHHWGTHTETNIVARGVMLDAAQTILNGVTKIEKGATKANGVQAEKVLMLSPEARGDANPILLIDENDVQAGHAASVGKIDPIQMFYLMSRGLSRRQAERLVIFGFVGPVLDTIPFDSLRERITDVIEGKLSS
ncbi:Fe-S cluster assembly protein SufD [Marininema mesophilum]|uniref:Fe-S cluster assembly protein SufD n=1 Tax=Marininema mesophilum TaxID=1048340 RepID=A0A1H2YM91_9BACL|nr:Fe-S cluster assembly protein SufD [Marininema mesophilum]SDX06111.1 Fe-S cluster assembly protein SufD [Marininema mesophilum]